MISPCSATGSWKNQPMHDPEAIRSLIQTFELPAVTTSATEAQYQAIVDHINALLQKDFSQLVSLLYRLDVSEAKLRALLQQNPDTDAAILIANLVLERQAQKIRSRRENTRRDHEIDENEKW
jgi:hypothetical protein